MRRLLNELRSGALFGGALALILTFACAAAAQQKSNDAVLVLPFENTSAGNTEYNWIGQSFADSLADLINISDLRVITGDEREIAYRRLRLPVSAIPSRATSIKLAHEARANLVVIGSYEIIPAQNDAPAAVQGKARIVRVLEGRIAGDVMLDGAWAIREYDFGGALTTLQAMQGRLAYQILYQRDKALAVSQREMVDRATKVPQQAFEALVKGLLTRDMALRENYLLNSLSIYEKETAGETYIDAAFELGELYLSRGNWQKAVEYFSRIQKKDRRYLEATFLAGYSYYKLNDYSHALASFAPLTTESRLTSAFNNAGAISLQAALAEVAKDERARLLEQSVGWLKRAAESTAKEDIIVPFNYAYALFTSGKYADAVALLQPVLAANPNDGQAHFLYAKALEKAGQKDAAAAADDLAKRFAGQNYAAWQIEWEKSQTLNLPVRVLNFNRDVFLSETAVAETDTLPAEEDLLVKARQLYANGADEEALIEIRRALTIEPMNAEAYLIIGRIQFRQANSDQAVSALKTSIFWNSKMVDAHVLLGRIFLSKKDCPQASIYARSALSLDAKNQEAIALQRLIDTTCK